MNYGVYALRKAFEAGLHDHIVQSAADYMDGCCDLLTRTLTKIELPPEEMLALRSGRAAQGGFFEEWEFPTVQLRKRLGGAGIRSEAIDTLDLQWFRRIDQNIREYEDRFGEPHPAIERDAEGYAKLQARIGAKG